MVLDLALRHIYCPMAHALYICFDLPDSHHHEEGEHRTLHLLPFAPYTKPSSHPFAMVLAPLSRELPPLYEVASRDRYKTVIAQRFTRSVDNA